MHLTCYSFDFYSLGMNRILSVLDKLYLQSLVIITYKKQKKKKKKNYVQSVSEWILIVLHNIAWIKEWNGYNSQLSLNSEKLSPN